MIYVDKKGNQTTQKNVFSNERIEFLENPIFEKIYRWYYFDRTSAIVKKGNLLVAYNEFISDQYELKNYLSFKTVNFVDYLRAGWHLYMTSLGLTNAYRYDHLISRSDFIYEYESVKYALDLPNKTGKDKAVNHLKFLKFLLE